MVLNTFANDTVVRCDNKNKYDRRRQRKNGRNTFTFFPSDLLFVFRNGKNYTYLAWCFSLSFVSCEIECVKSCFSRLGMRFVQERDGVRGRKLFNTITFIDEQIQLIFYFGRYFLSWNPIFGRQSEIRCFACVCVCVCVCSTNFERERWLAKRK